MRHIPVIADVLEGVYNPFAVCDLSYVHQLESVKFNISWFCVAVQLLRILNFVMIVVF